MQRNNLYLSPREPVLEKTNVFTRIWYRFFEEVAVKIRIIDGTETTTATAGVETLPAQPAGFFTFVKEDGTPVKVPYYNE